ncbi:hypothetical protein CEP54_015924 [Fusarium duplospermum]|uniref:Uncharacterized protein n=1 Tax=Fusarium duplospermum TaxID=1325734 RepID=A0A428NJX3_9HYPO|nr:hypothetical protein CEP54_015924 [Fusarium duplospermum]
MNQGGSITPAAFWSHGSPLLCYKDSDSSECWTQFGKAAQENGIKGVVFIGAHWEELDDRIRVATKPNPEILQMDLVPRSYWENYPINVDIELAEKVINLLRLVLVIICVFRAIIAFGVSCGISPFVEVAGYGGAFGGLNAFFGLLGIPVSIWGKSIRQFTGHFARAKNDNAE